MITLQTSWRNAAGGQIWKSSGSVNHVQRRAITKDNNTQTMAFEQILSVLKPKIRGTPPSQSGAPPPMNSPSPVSKDPALPGESQNLSNDPGQKNIMGRLINVLNKPDYKKPEPKAKEEEEAQAKDMKKHMNDLFGEKKKKLHLMDLNYWNFYPNKIRKWLVFTKTVPGHYDRRGKWVSSSAIEDFLSTRKEDFPREDLAAMEKIFLQEQGRLPEDLKGQFRFGVHYDEIKDLHPKIRRLFSFTFATPGEVLRFRKRMALEKWRAHPSDTASDPVQIDVLTRRIQFLRAHMKKNHKDQSNKRALVKLIKRRKSLMQHLKKSNVETYFAVLRELKLKDMYHVWDERVY